MDVWKNPETNKLEVWKPEKSETKGWLGIGQDIYESGKEFLPTFLNALKQLPSEVGGMAVNPQRIPQNLLAGLAQGGAGTLNIPANIRDYLVKKDIVSPESPNLRLPESVLPRDYNYAKGVGLEDQMPGDVLTQGLGMLPYMAAGEVGALGVPARMAARSAAQVPLAIGQNQNPIHAAAMVPGFELPIRGAMRGYQAMRPANALRGNLPIEELQANARAAEGTNTDLGNIIGSPMLKQIFENLTTKWPGSGSDELLARQGRQVENRAQGLLDESAQGLGPADRNAQLKSALETAYENQRIRKNELYEPVNTLSEQEGFSLGLPSTRNLASSQMRSILTSPLMQHNPKFRAALGKLLGLENPEIAVESAILNRQGAPLISETIRPSILDANMTAAELWSEGTQLKNNKNASAHDRAIGGLYRDLATNIRSDISHELSQRGSPALQQAYNAATRNYRENFSQFLDQDIYRLAQPEVEAETIINDVIKPGKKGDKFTRIEKIQNALPPEQRNILGNAWLRNALDKEGTLNAKQFSRLISELGPRQFEALFPDANYRQRLLDYGRLRGMNEKALSRMANPNTGQQLAAPSMIAGQVSGVTTALATGNPLKALGLAIGPQIGSRMANRALTSPAVRQRIIDNILANEGILPGQLSERNMISALLATYGQQEPFLTTASGVDVYE